ncbi:Lysosomal alpha-mannosidase [Araneus ventricosus]|uniref:Lysosomal alpha-mannosidase n=1 Tax=Araneus ventricosus TaxID=182803 RepID=A0A4Y2X9A1_ARAVE|nr:Lysosomal alpha-mannosidase [Araneus ventricosus]
MLLAVVTLWLLCSWGFVSPYNGLMADDDSVNLIIRSSLKLQALAFSLKHRRFKTQFHQRTTVYIAINIYNPLAWNVTKYIRIPVSGKAYKIIDYNGNSVDAQIVPLPSPVYKIPGRNSKAQAEVVFEAKLPALGYATYLMRNTTSQSVKYKQASGIEQKTDGDWILNNKFLSVYVDSKSGLLRQLQLADGTNLTVNQSFYWYRGMNGDNSNFDKRASGAYIFRPNGTEPIPLGNNVTVNFVNGSVVQEIHQTFNPWLSQVIRLYKDSENIEFRWIIGPIPIE